MKSKKIPPFHDGWIAISQALPHAHGTFERAPFAASRTVSTETFRSLRRWVEKPQGIPGQ